MFAPERITPYIVPGSAIIGGIAATALGGGVVGIPLLFGGVTGVAIQASKDATGPTPELQAHNLPTSTQPAAAVAASIPPKNTPVRVGYYDLEGKWVMQWVPANKVTSLKELAPSQVFINVIPVHGVSEWKSADDDSADESKYVLASHSTPLPATPPLPPNKK